MTLSRPPSHPIPVLLAGVAGEMCLKPAPNLCVPLLPCAAASCPALSSCHCDPRNFSAARSSPSNPFSGLCGSTVRFFTDEDACALSLPVKRPPLPAAHRQSRSGSSTRRTTTCATATRPAPSGTLCSGAWPCRSFCIRSSSWSSSASMSETAGRGPSSCEAEVGVCGHQSSVKEGAQG